MNDLVSWYADHAAPHVEANLPKRAKVIAETLKRLRRARESATQELPVCFLGQAGVGKSTLINALVAESETVLPQGGVGPLTAQATVVRYAERRSFTARYLHPKRVNRVLFALERSLDRASAAAPEIELDAEDLLDVELAQADSDDQSTTSKVDAYRRQASQMVRGKQFDEISVEYLCDRLRECMSLETKWGTTAEEDDERRIARVAEVLSASKADETFQQHVELGDDTQAFYRELAHHASGFLAPILRTLEVEWDSAQLEGGLVLVDLPGIGIANDEYRQVTAEWIRRARAVVLVVDRAGVTEASVELLRTTGFLNSMLHDALGEDADPPILMVSVVKVDLQASDARTKERQLNAGKARKWIEHFDEHCEQLVSVIKGQLSTELSKTVASGADETLSSREEVMRSLLDRLEIHPVSAHEYRMLLEDDEDERPHIRDEEQSRVPQFGRALRGVVEAREARLASRLRELDDEAHEKISAALRMIRAQWEQEDRAAEEAEKLRRELDEFVRPLRDQLSTRNGQFREFLRETVPAHIETATLEASREAQKEIKKYLSRLRKYHWATLRAAVRRGGTFVGARHVDVPNELTLRFEEPVAVVWSKQILSELRRRTRSMGDDYVDLVGGVVEWTRGQGARVRPELVEALHDSLKADTRDLGRVGKDAVTDLKAAVKADLFKKVNKKVERRCKKFVDQQEDVGRGVQERIHGMLDELAGEVVDAARPTAIKVLTQRYMDVEEEIRSAFEEYPNPIDQAVDAIVSQHEDYRRRSDAQKRGKIIAASTELLEQLEQLRGAGDT